MDEIEKNGGRTAGQNEIDWDAENEKNWRNLQAMIKMMDIIDTCGEPAEKAIGAFLDFLDEVRKKGEKTGNRQ